MEVLLKKFEKTVTYVLLILSMIVIGYQVIQLIWELAATLWNRITQSGLAYDPQNTSNYGALFFSVLLSLEILETIRLFHQDNEIKLRLIFIVAMIAISRKLLALGTLTGNGDVPSYLATGGLILAFSVGYFLIRKAGVREAGKKK